MHCSLSSIPIAAGPFNSLPQFIFSWAGFRFRYPRDTDEGVISSIYSRWCVEVKVAVSMCLNIIQLANSFRM